LGQKQDREAIRVRLSNFAPLGLIHSKPFANIRSTIRHDGETALVRLVTLTLLALLVKFTGSWLQSEFNWPGVLVTRTVTMHDDSPAET